MTKTIAIITARSGSIRIPKKNIKIFMGKPMLSYALKAAIEAKIFNTVMVSTDSKEIAEIALELGADVPFLRSSRNSDNYATTKDFLQEVLNEYNKRGETFDIVSCIYPCVPFLNSEILQDAYNQFIVSEAEALIPVVRFSYPIQRALKLNNSNYLEYIYPEYENSRSQDLETTYHDVGMFYFYKKNLFPQKIMMYEMDEVKIQDIDTESDWKMAELKYKMLNKI